MASIDLKEIVAQEIASGESIAEIAKRHGYSWKGMSKLVKTSEVQRLVAAERERLGELLAQHRARLTVLAGQALDNIERAVRDPENPQCANASRFVLDKMLGSKNSTSLEIVSSKELDPAVRGELLAGIAELSKKLNQARLANPVDEYVLEG